MIVFLQGLFLACFFLGGCYEREPVRIGIAVQLTGKQAELGVQERNAVQLAVESINGSGGIQGRPVELITRDDLGTPAGAGAAMRDLIAAGVVAVIGPATSSQAMVEAPMADNARLVMLSPTVSSPLFSGKDDYFFRVFPTFSKGAYHLAESALVNRGVSRIAILYDSDNAAYAGTYAGVFAERFRALGGAITGEVGFSSRTEPDFVQMLAKVFAGRPNGILVIASDDDTALIAQRTRMRSGDIPIFIANWAMTETLILNGGKAVEGLEGEQGYDMNSKSPPLADFLARYKARFGQAPTFGAAFAYEAADVLAAALRRTGGKPAGLKQALLGTRDFKGLVDTFSFDGYGDVERPHYICVIRDGRFATVDVIKRDRP
ncbi:MAG TPA: ABC transporter substrate-binding protein [Desulfuromonadaceae bacterium]